MERRFRNVNDAFRGMVIEFSEAGRRSPNICRSTSRVGDVLYIQEPCTITYTHPRERVLFNQARDCNPFFHLYESLWMLAGRQDIAPLNYYSSGYAKQVQDGDNPNANGAYGFRWRSKVYDLWDAVQEGEQPRQKVDQLKIIIDQLKRKPDSRRCVLQMWNVEDDLLKIDTSKDVCCNTCAYFSIRDASNGLVAGPHHPNLPYGTPLGPKVLDMTVCNRSNDLIWGTLGANAVHFSFLQEYLAACIGCEVGVYNQFSNNQHVYVDRFEPEKWLADTSTYEYADPPQSWKLVPLVKDPETFDRECAMFVERHQRDAIAGLYYEPFLKDTAQPMMIAFHCHKRRDYGSALSVIKEVESDDWCIAATNWLLKRKANYDAKTSAY